MKSRGSDPQIGPFLTNFGSHFEPARTPKPLSTAVQWLPGVHSGSHRDGHIVASLYIPSRARVGRIGSDFMIHTLQSVTFGMSHFGFLTRFCKMFQKGEIRGHQIRTILDPKRVQKGSRTQRPTNIQEGRIPCYGRLTLQMGSTRGPKTLPKWTNLGVPNGHPKNGPILSTFGQDPIGVPTGSRPPDVQFWTCGSFFVLMPLDPKIGTCPKTGVWDPKWPIWGYWPKGSKKGIKPRNKGSKYEGPNSLIEANMALGSGPHIWSPGTPDPGSLDHDREGSKTPDLGCAS